MTYLEIAINVVKGYFLIGITFNFLIFLWAKARHLDERVEDWKIILTSIWGLCYFIFIGGIVWLPIFLGILFSKQKRRWFFTLARTYIRIKRKCTL